MGLIRLIQAVQSALIAYPSLGFICFGSDLFFVCVVAVIFWCFSKKAATKIIFTCAMFLPVICLANAIAGIPFPFARGEGVGTMHIISSHAAGYSVPSIGVFMAAVLAIGIMANNSNIAVKIICVACTVLTVFSYMYLGLCTIWSAAISVCLGGALVIIFSKFVDGTLFDIRQYPLYLLIAAVPGIVLLIVTVSLYLNGVIPLSAFAVYLRLTGMNIAFLFSWFFESNFVRFSIRCDRAYKQFLKVVIGLSSTLLTWFVLYFALNFIPGFWPAAFICSFIVTLGSFSAYPVFIKAVF